MNKKLREKVWNKYGKKCAYCGNSIMYERMQVDHYIPKRNKLLAKKYGVDNVNHIDNLMPSCRRCNHYKRAHLLEEFRNLLMTLHERVAKQYISKVAVDYGIIKIDKWDGKFYFERLKGGD